MRTTEVAIIGAGSAGLNAFRHARKQTDSVLLIDPGPLGTTCARVGCMPSKLLIAAADAAWGIREADALGIRTESVRVDDRAVLKRVREMRDHFVDNVLKGMKSIPEDLFIRQPVRFISDHQLQTGDSELIEAERIVIATGSRAFIPEFLQAADDRLLINDDLFELERLPKSVAVFGPGVIGLELGQALHRLGVRIRMFGVGGLIGPLGDPEMKERATALFGSEYPLDTDAQVKQISRSESGVEITYPDKDGELITDTFDYLLAATGRRPQVDHLGLENTSIKRDERGMPLYDRHTLQCAPGHIFIAGDANGELPLLHEASDEGVIAGRNAGRYPNITPGKRTTPLAIVFSDPQIATVGLTYKEIQALNNVEVVSAGFDFAQQARAKVLNRARGMMKLWADKHTGTLLGGELMGPEVEHLGHLLAWAMERGQTVDEMLEMPYYHPTLEEGLRTLLRTLARKPG